jgi:deferrochelatase/peroxidase EfeB
MNVRPDHSRRFFLKGAVAVAVTAPAAQSVRAAVSPAGSLAEPFFGKHQAGIASPAPKHTYFIAFDMLSNQRDDLVRLLKLWTAAAADMTQTPEKFDLQADPRQAPQTSGAAVGLSPAGLTITFGLGPSLFEKNGVDRFGLNAQRPEALTELPRFAGDQLVPERCGGDLSVQACANDLQVLEAAVRRMAKLANGIAVMRWAQTGFNGSFKPTETPRNQMGFKDGTINVSSQDPRAMNDFVWVGDEGPAWLRGGSYMVIRPIRISMEHWDEMTLAFQEETVGRHKASGAPIGKTKESDALDLAREDKDGNLITSDNSHAALSAPENNGGAQILRRAFNYDNGITRVAERWPPWRQVMTFDAGLLFQCYQKDPRTGFNRIFAKMAQIDMLNQFTTHVGSGVFACPPGVHAGEFIGQALF